MQEELIPDSEQNENDIVSNEQGQTLVEFMLLLVSIMLISMSFMKIINTNIGKYWEAMGNTLLIDVEGTQKLNLR